MTTGFLIISLWWRITLLKQRGLCELSEIAKTLSIVHVKVFRLFICLYENMGAVDVELPRSRNSKKWKISHWTREKSFLWMEAVFGNEFCKLQIYLSFSCYRIEIRTSKNSDKLWAYWVSLTVCKEVHNLSFLRQTLNKFISLIILGWYGVRSCSKISQKPFKCWHFPSSARETGKESFLVQCVKPVVMFDWRPPNRRFELKKKPFDGKC